MSAGNTLTNKIRIESVRRSILEILISEDISYSEIAGRVGLHSKQSVGHHVKVLFTQYRTANTVKAEQWRQHEIEKCNFGESESYRIAGDAHKTYRRALMAWEKSQGKAKVTTKKARIRIENVDGKAQETMSPSEATIREEERPGDPRFLAAMMVAKKTELEAIAQARAWAARRQKLMGLEQPKRIQITTPTILEVESMTDDQLQEELRRIPFLLTDGNEIPAKGNGNGNGHGPH